MSSETVETYPDDSIDFAELFRRLKRGLITTLGLAILGGGIGVLMGLISTRMQTPVSSLRITFGFPGAEHGTYPNGTKFQPDDVRAPDVINEALDRLGVDDPTGAIASRVRGGIIVAGLIPPSVIKERDRLRAAGQTLTDYFPDEYEISLSLPQDHALDRRQRERLITEIVSVFRDKFRRTYVELPPQFANAFEQLKDADFLDYELILTRQMQELRGFLEQQAEGAKQFRSPTNHLSFQDLLKQTDLFTQIRMNDVLSLIYLGGLSKDRQHALAAMDYQIQSLSDQEQRLLQEEAVVTNLLSQSQERAQSYVVATKTATQRPDQPILDQGLIDSILANDAYNLLVRRALDAGMAVKDVQAEKALVQERRKRLYSFITDQPEIQEDAIQRVENALKKLQVGYTELLGNVRTCLEDYARQEYANAVRITMQAATRSWLKPLALGGIIGGFVGLSFGLGFSLLNLTPQRPTPAA